MKKEVASCAFVGKLVSENYHCCSHIASVEYHNDNVISSNQHYVITTKISKYFLKVIIDADALFQGDALLRIKTVAESINQLQNTGLHLEHIVLNKDGQFITKSDNTIYRLYEFIEGRHFNSTDKDIKQASISLSNFHKKAHKLLSRDTYNKLKYIKVPYSLDQSIKNIFKIQQSINELSFTPNTHEDTFMQLSNEFKYIEQGIDRVSSLITQEKDYCLVHLDFHPDNVIYDDSGVANMIDLDSAMLGNTNKCTAFSILRFSLYNQSTDYYKRIVEVSKIWINNHENKKSLQLQDLINWMIYVELEKILRIVTRYIQTGKYSKFLKNIDNTHLPNLKLLLNNEHS
jgi:hypothetical protein